MRLLLILALAVLLASCAHDPSPSPSPTPSPAPSPGPYSPPPSPPPPAIVQFAGAPPLRADVADEPAERERGLMFRPGLASGEALLFVFPEERAWGFWMKNVNFEIDMIWLSANGTVVHVFRAPPCRADPCPIYTPPAPALYVVETTAGFSADHSIGSGARVEIPGLIPRPGR